MSYAHLIDVDHQNIQAQIVDDQKKQVTSRKSLYKKNQLALQMLEKKRDDCDTKKHNNVV